MSGVSFAAAYLAGSALIALWITVRYPELCPEELRNVILHVAAGTLCIKLVAPVASGHLPSVGSDAATTLMGLFLITLPFLTYWLVGIAWVIRACTNLIGSGIR